VSAEDGDELGLDHAAEDIGPGNHSHQFSASHHWNANNVMGSHLGDHGLDCVVFLNTDLIFTHLFATYERVR
jgi:hypothetical protein